MAAAVAGVPVVASAGAMAPGRGSEPLPARHAGLLMRWAGGADWMGSFETGGRIVICLSPGKILTAPTSWRTGQWGSAAESAELSWLYANGGDSGNNVTAAAARIDMLKVTGGLGYYRGLVIPAAVAAEMSRLEAGMRAGAGPYTRNLAFPRETTTPGQQGAAQLNVVSASHHAVAGLAAGFTAGNALIGAAGRSGRPQPFTELGSPVRVTGSALAPADDLRIGVAGKAFQTLVYGLTARLAASASYSPHPAGARASAVCECDGTGNVTGVITQAAGSDEGRYALLVNGKAAATVTAPAGAGSVILKATAADGAAVTFTAAYLARGRWSAPVALGGAFTVICPATPELAQRCRCDETLTLASPLPAASGYAESLVWTAGGRTFAVPVPAGGARSVAFSVSSGPVTYWADVDRGGTVVASTPRMAGGFAQ